MITSLKILFAACEVDAIAAISDRLAPDYQLKSRNVFTFEELERELTSGDCHLIVVSFNGELSLERLLSEKENARQLPAIFVLCDEDSEVQALEAVRRGADEVIRLDDLRRLLPAVARALRNAERKSAFASRARGRRRFPKAGFAKPSNGVHCTFNNLRSAPSTGINMGRLSPGTPRPSVSLVTRPKRPWGAT